VRVLVVTVVHDPRDARIFHREIGALLAAGHEVTYAAPFSAYGVALPTTVRAIDVPRSRGRRRIHAARAARAVVRREAPAHDVVLVHDPELLAAVRGIDGPVVAWDVHEDTAAAVTLKPWLPVPLRRATAAGVRTVESRAEKRVRLILAEDGYRDRFDRPHPVVPNSTPAPETVLPSGEDRVVYVGSITVARGVHEMVELGRLLHDLPITVHLVGPADAAAREVLEPAQAAGVVQWHGFLPNDEALALVDGALAGLSLLHDEPNYRHSKPTKVIEYMAHGVPVISTPTPPAVELVDGTGCGIVVPFDDAPAVAIAVRRLHADPVERQAMADRGRAAALEQHDWRRDGTAFVDTLQRWVSEQAARPVPR
jgi:glycosyltransferase involved in cell wall biosynthesis